MLTNSLKKIVLKIRGHYRVQQWMRYLRPWMPARPRWKSILKHQSLSTSKNQNKKILLATSTGAHWAMSGFESVLGAALSLRGAEVEVLLCDGMLPACQECDLRFIPAEQLLKKGNRSLCNTCFKPAQKMFAELKLPIITYSQWLSNEDQLEIQSQLKKLSVTNISTFTWRGIAVGEHAFAGALRFFGRGSLEHEPHGQAILLKYLHAAMLATASLQCLFKTKQYDSVVFHHGIYVPQGLVGDVCRQYGLAVVNWNPAYRERTYLFSHEDTYHKTMIDEPTSEWMNLEWDQQKDLQLMSYLNSRRTGGKDWISFQRSDQEINVETIGLDPKRPIIGLLTNVMWDAQLHFKHNAFNSMLEWLLSTVDYFTKHTELQLIIRIHPAEVLGGVPARQRAEDEIRTKFPNLPKSICIISPESSLNTYALMENCNAVLVYGTKMAIELPCWGLPVVVAGEAWARAKGFTIDVSTREEYFSILRSLPLNEPLSETVKILAKKYAYHLFYRRMIPVKFARRFPRLVPFAYDISSLDVIKQGADPGLDLICEGILTGRSFIFDPMTELA